MTEPVDSRPYKQRLADALLAGGLDEYVQTRRSEGRSWRLIARDIWTDTDGQVDVTEVTLRGWFEVAA